MNMFTRACNNNTRKVSVAFKHCTEGMLYMYLLPSTIQSEFLTSLENNTYNKLLNCDCVKKNKILEETYMFQI